MFNLFLDVVADPTFMERNGRLVWVIVALLAIGGLVALFIWKKRKQQREGNKPGNPNQKP